MKLPRMSDLKLIWKIGMLLFEMAFSVMAGWHVYKLTHDFVIAVATFSVLLTVYRTERKTEAKD